MLHKTRTALTITLIVTATVPGMARPQDQALATHALEARLTEFRPYAMHSMEAKLSLEISAEAIALLPREDHLEADLEIRLATILEDGRCWRLPTIPWKLTVSDPPEAGENLAYVTTISLRRHTERLIVTLQDKISGAKFSKGVIVKAPKRENVSASRP